MKTLIFTIGSPAKGDLIVINGKSPRGGQTSVKYTVIGARVAPVFDGQGNVVDVTPVPPETPAQIAEKMASDMFGAWLPDLIQARVSPKGDLIVTCTDLCDHVFSTEVQGTGGTTITTQEL